MSKPDGVYMSADFRVTENQSGRVLSDTDAKVLQIQFPPIDHGTRGVIAFTGLARLPDGTTVGDWIRETLRGETEPPDVAMAHLRTRLDRDIGATRYPLHIAGVFVEGEHGERRVLIEFSNLWRPDEFADIQVQASFKYRAIEIPKPAVVGAGSGFPVIAKRHVALLKEQLNVRPRRPLDHMNLLAVVNAAVADVDSRVSRACQVAYIPAERPRADNRQKVYYPQSRSFGRTQVDDGGPAAFPMIFMGIDLTWMMEDGFRRLAALKSGEETPPEQSVEDINRRLRRRQ